MNENLQTVVDSVNEILKDTNHIPKVEAVAKRLVSFGYTPTEEDAWMIAFTMQKVMHHVLNEINHTKVPDELFEVVVDMVCGEFLLVKFQTGKLVLDSLDLDGMIQSVTEGDTTVSFSTEGSDESKFNSLLTWLIQGKGSDLLCYRKMRW